MLLYPKLWLVCMCMLLNLTIYSFISLGTSPSLWVATHLTSSDLSNTWPRICPKKNRGQLSDGLWGLWGLVFGMNKKEWPRFFALVKGLKVKSCHWCSSHDLQAGGVFVWWYSNCWWKTILGNPPKKLLRKKPSLNPGRISSINSIGIIVSSESKPTLLRKWDIEMMISGEAGLDPRCPTHIELNRLWRGHQVIGMLNLKLAGSIHTLLENTCWCLFLYRKLCKNIYTFATCNTYYHIMYTYLHIQS